MKQEKNIIPVRVAEFLKAFSPFGQLPESELLSLAESIEIAFYEQGQVLFNEGDKPPEKIYIVYKGSVRLVTHIDEKEELVDVADEGDSFGIAPLLAKRNYILSAVANEDVLMYLVEWEPFSRLLANYPSFAVFFAAGFAAGPSYQLAEVHRAKKTYHVENDSLLREDDFIEIDSGKSPLTTPPEAPIQDAVRRMTERGFGSIIVTDEQKYPIGIITDTDLRRKVATGDVGVDEPVSSIMNSPVFTISTPMPIATAILIIMKKNLRHLVVTQNGDVHSKVLGVLSEHDLLVLHGNNPVVLVKEAWEAKNIKYMPAIRQRAEDMLLRYMEKGTSISFLAEVITELNDVIIEKAIDTAIEDLIQQGLKNPGLKFAWLSLGSEGRGEQFLRTDQDNAIIYEDPSPEMEAEAKEYFVALGKRVNKLLNTCGFEFCPAQIMAGNPKWNLSETEWKRTFANWIDQPDPKAVMHTTIFFDFRANYGHTELAERLKAFLKQRIPSSGGFLRFLAKNAMQNPPPLSFFRNFIIERSGDQKNRFDIKARAIMPIVDAARTMSLELGYLESSNTFDRLRYLASYDTGNAKIIEEGIMAYEIILHHRILSGLRNQNTGRYILINVLGKIERQSLRSTFETIMQIQKMISLRYGLEALPS